MGRQRISMAEEIRKCRHIDVLLYLGNRHQGFDFRCEGKSLPIHIVVKRFYPEPVARGEEHFLPFIPNCECEHSTEVMNTVVTKFLPCFENRLGIGSSTEAVTGATKPRSQIGKIVDFTIEDDPDRTVLV